MASNLRNHDFNHPEILVFSFEDEVLELLEEGSSSTVNGRSMLFCNDRTASSNKDKVKYYEYVDTEAGFKYQVQAKHGYQTAGIYFSLMTQVKHMSKPLEAGNLSPWSTSNTYLHLERYTKFKRRCSSTHEGNSPITKLWDNKINFRPHEGTKKLARYIIKSTYTIEERNVLGNGLLVDIVLEDLNDGY